MDPPVPSSSTKRPRGRPRKPLLAVSEATPRARPRDTDDKTASPQPRPQPVDATPTSHVVQTDGHAVDDVVDDVDADAAVTPVATRLPMAVVGDDAADTTVTPVPVDGGDGSAVADASADAVDADDDQLLVDAEQMRGRSEEAMQHMR